MEMIAEQIKELLPYELRKVTYIGELPTDADACVALVESGGPHGTYFAKDRMDTPYLKVVVRDPFYPNGYSRIKQIKDLLTSYADAQTLGIVLRGDITYFGRDDKRRNTWQLTFKIYSYIGG